jgi:hypothetical protein
MPRISRGIVLLCDQVWMAGAPIAARPNCGAASSFSVCKPVSWLFITQGCPAFPSDHSKDCSWHKVSYKWHIMSGVRSRSEPLLEWEVT